MNATYSVLRMALRELVRPFLLVIVAFLVFHYDTVLYKLQLVIRGIAYLLFCNDKTWTKPNDPYDVFQPLLDNSDKKDQNKFTIGIERKTVIFVRHGESTWNDTFNKGHNRNTFIFVIGFIPNFIKALLYELYLLLSGQIDSWFYDSPLSHLGISQAQQLRLFLKKEPIATLHQDTLLLNILRGKVGAPNSKVVCSSLRRALSTVIIAFYDRFERHPNESITVLPSLQEISRNPDALSITCAYASVIPSWIEQHCTVCDFVKMFEERVDVSRHDGNKPIRTSGLKRMLDFCHYVFSSSVKEDYVIAGGHSIWFRSFFQTFLPYDMDHVAKHKKVVNAGCIAFDLMRTINLDKDENVYYMIDVSSIRVVYGGF